MIRVGTQDYSVDTVVWLVQNNSSNSFRTCFPNGSVGMVTGRGGYEYGVGLELCRMG